MALNSTVSEMWVTPGARPVRRFTVKAPTAMEAMNAVPANVGKSWDSITPLYCREINSQSIGEGYWSVECVFNGPMRAGWVYPPLADDDFRLPLLSETVRERYTLRPAPPAWLGVLGLIALGCLLAWVISNFKF